MILYYVCFLIFSFIFSRCVSAEILVTVPNGQILGLELTSPGNKTFYGFRGIPYARPPLGDLRFQAPVPAENWEGVLDATKDGYACVNMKSEVSSSQSEDCLFLNVYTPKLNSDTNETLLPVMFWIYGGGFQTGTASYSSYGPDYLIEEDVVFVSVNYRLGPFGFLSTGDQVIPGNAGLKDQNLALQWTNQNIHLFGGDPNKITIFGQSAGAASVTYHLLSPKSSGLFRAAISESGTALCQWSLNQDAKAYAYQLLDQISKNNNLNIDTESLTSTELLTILRNQTVQTIKTAENEIFNILHPLPTPPVLEVDHENAFLTESSYELLDTGKFNAVPLLIGFNSEEFLSIAKTVENVEIFAALLDIDNKNLIPFDLPLANLTIKEQVAEEIKAMYNTNGQLFLQNLGMTVRYNSDNWHIRPILKYAELHSKFSDVFSYEFAYHGLLSIRKNFTIGGALGTVGHAEEMGYLFKLKDGIEISEQDILVRKRMTKLWTNFAKFLNPTPETSELLQNVTWPVLNQQSFQYLNISENLEVLNGYPREGTFEKWNNIYNSYGARPFFTF